MKHQYFGDVNDYRKYGLLRALLSQGDLRLSVAWMTTPDDGSSDGNLRWYLDAERRWGWYDSELYVFLRASLAGGSCPHLSMIEGGDILPRASFYSAIVPDDATDRRAWSDGLLEFCRTGDLVFLDPDNGLEIASRPIGRKDSSKFLAWKEVEALSAAGKSLLIYQHFRREPRVAFVERIAGQVRERTGASFVEAFSTPYVLFLLAGHESHSDALLGALPGIRQRWTGQLEVVGLSSG